MEFDELLEHLEDLIELAHAEGYVAFAVQLANFCVAANYNRGAFMSRDASSATTTAPSPAGTVLDPRD